jgi:anthranilate 1,2-dioxygenase large subunit
MTQASMRRGPSADGTRVPYGLFTEREIYDLEQERIYRGPTWSFLGLEAELAGPGDFKSTYIGDSPVVVTRDAVGKLHGWVNRCAHRGAIVCREKRGNALSHTCVYHQWSYDCAGDLRGVPFRRGHKGMVGMPADFDPVRHGLQKLRIAAYAGLVFGTFHVDGESLEAYLGEENRRLVDRIFHKDIEFLGVTRQFSKSNWKLYFENAKDPYHASLLHLFHTTFNIARVGMTAHCIVDSRHGLHSTLLVVRSDATNIEGYKQQNIRSYREDITLADPTLLEAEREFELDTTNHIQAIFPSLVIQQIHNTLVCRQLLPKGPDAFELNFHFFGYVDDSPALRRQRIRQANLVGPAGYISMEDTEATELVQRGIARDPHECSVIEMARDAPPGEGSMITEGMVRSMWQGYRGLMGLTETP